MSVRIKFCGLTRPEDVQEAERLGAAYIGAVFAGGPRMHSGPSAAELFRVRNTASRVGVWGTLQGDNAGLAAIIKTVPLDIVQLHADPTSADVESVRQITDPVIPANTSVIPANTPVIPANTPVIPAQAGIQGRTRHSLDPRLRGDDKGARADGIATQVWAVIRIGEDAVIAPEFRPLFDIADAVVLDTRAPSNLGGTGKAFNWTAVADQVNQYRSSAMVIVAGGLTPENVAEAVRTLRPDVVDVSSGVEAAPGIKDHRRMQQFVDAVRGA